MNSSQKIKLNQNNKEYDRYIKIKLDNEIESLEFLSIKINSTDIYQSFNADYGVLVGRVVANNGIGVPNAKISIFIPLTDEDEFDENIKYIYPFKNPRDKNSEGKRYNLLPRVSKIDPTTGVIRPQQAFGSFPIKEEIVVNVNHLDVYKKYYKYTALTNQFGDYMIFGAPIGTQTVHMSLDITDIGEYSMTPASMVTNLGYSENLFIENNTRIKPSDDLNDLPHIETQDITVDIIPFWGDSDNYDIGITRQDFRVRTTLNNTFTIFGNAFTDNSEAMWGAPTSNNTITPHELYYIGDSADLDIISKRGVLIDETIFYYPATISDFDIDNGFADETDMVVLSKSEYSRYIEPDGRFVYIINCNRRKKVLNEENILVDVEYDFNGGIFTEFRGFVVFETDSNATKMNAVRFLGNDRGRVEPFRYKLKVPQTAYIGKTFGRDDENLNTIAWKKQNYKFVGGKIYSVSRFHGLVCNTENQTNVDIDYNGDGMLNKDVENDLNRNPDFNVGIIKSPLTGVTNSYIVPYGFTGTTLGDPTVIGFFGNVPYPQISAYTYTVNPNDVYPLIVNVDIITKGDKSKSLVPNSNNGDYFGAEWLNLSLYFPQIGELKSNIGNNDNVRSTTHFNNDVKNPFFYENNIQEIAAGEVNTKHFGRSDINKTTFIEVTKSDINDFINQPNNGFVKTSGITGTYISNTNKYYFYKGYGVDCVKYLKKIGLV